jgi:hypothetical protein
LLLVGRNRGETEDRAHDASHAIPLLSFSDETAATLRCKRVVTGTAVVLALTPLATKITIMFEAIERRIERTLLNDELFTRDLLDAEENSIAMKISKRDGLEDKEIECPLKEISGLGGH